MSNSSLNSKRPAEDQPEQWQVPKRTVSLINQNKYDSARDLTTSNQFQNLEVDGVENQSNRYYIAATTAEKKTGHIPPIIIDMKNEWTHESVKNLIGQFSNRYHLQYRNGGKVAVICYTSEAHQAIKDGLRQQGASFLTYTRKDEKVPKVVIKGLPTYVKSDLPGELAKLGFEGITVTTLQSRNAGSSHCSPFLIQLAAGADIKKFRQIKYLFNSVITVHKYKPKNSGGTQCFRCQGFGHSSKNCNMPPRCVKCTEPHPTSECPKKDRTQPARCCNCNENHPANFRQCTVRTAYLQRIQQKKELERRPLQLQFPNKTPKFVDGRPWASLLKEDIPVANSAPIHTTTSTTKDPVTMEILEIVSAIESMKSEFMKCGSMLAKVTLVLNYLGKYI